MNVISAYCTVLAGPTIPVPLPAQFADAIQSIEVIHSDSHSGFKIEFAVGRGNLLSALDYPLISSSLVKPFNRVSITVTFNLRPRLLMDGIITHVQLNPSNQPGASTLTVMGKDLSIMMDRNEKVTQHPGENEFAIAEKILNEYDYLDIIPEVIPPPFIDTPSPTERIPVQNCTDLGYLRLLAKRFGYVFYVASGPIPFTNTAYWGPPQRVGIPQSALSVNLGPVSNVKNINFKYDALKPAVIMGQVLDDVSDTDLPVETFASDLPPLALSGTVDLNVRQEQLNLVGNYNYAQAFAYAQARTNLSRMNVITATGELDSARYGNVLQARSLVGVRGAGFEYDGEYYVKEVTHNLGRGFYTQSFTLTREGVGALAPFVVP